MTSSSTDLPESRQGAIGERQRELRASATAGWVALFAFVAALALVAGKGFTASDEPATKTTSVVVRTSQRGQPASTKQTTSKETSVPGSDRSLVGRAFGTGAAPIMFQILLAGLAAFAAGLLVQRILLGRYGITLGPVSIPELPPVSEPAATEAVDLITGSPEFAVLARGGRRGMHVSPQFRMIEDDRLALLSIRIELEERMRALAKAAGIDEDIALTRLPARLAREGAFNYEAARGFEKLLDIGDRIAAGARVDPDAASKIRDQAGYLLNALAELRSRREKEGGA